MLAAPRAAPRAPTWLVICATLLLGLTLVGAPAPSAVTPVELSLAGLVGLGALWIVGGVLVRPMPLDDAQPLLLAAVGGYLASFALSMVVGVAYGAPTLSMLRAVLPYVLFLPIAAVGLMPSVRDGAVRGILVACVLAGLAHSALLLGLYLTGVQNLLDTQTILVGRTTLLDARTTLPLFLGAAVLPLHVVARGSWPARVGAIALMALAALGSFSTQTRAQLLALGCAYVAFFFLYSRWEARMRGDHPTLAFLRFGRRAAITTALLAATILATPPLRALASAVVLRSQATGDNGRIQEEWIPVITEALQHGVTGVLFGIGGGQSFITIAGEERTYVHNLMLYALLYNGAIGLLLVLFLYLALFATLVRRAHVQRSAVYLSFASLLVALFVYAQLFAVHKLLSFNAMLALVIFVAFVRPVRLRSADDAGC